VRTREVGSQMISLLMPVYNSLSGQHHRYGFLAQAIHSLQSQNITDFELIILDNQSTDGTFEHCAEIARRDPRIRVIRDETRRSPEEAIRKLAEISESEYCAIVNDDDLWDRTYFKTLLNLLESNREVSLAYTNGRFLSPDGKQLGRIDTKTASIYSTSSTCETNFRNYLRFRNPFPISFGLFRREHFVECYPSSIFDKYGMNLDNIFIANFIRRGNHIIHLNSDLFFYRDKKRVSHFDRLGDIQTITPCEIFIRLMIHQLLVANELISTGDCKESILPADLANEEIILSTIESIKHLTNFLMMEYSLSCREFRQVKHFRNLIGESTIHQSIDLNVGHHRTVTGSFSYNLLRHLKASASTAFRESAELRAPLQTMFQVIRTLQN